MSKLLPDAVTPPVGYSEFRNQSGSKTLYIESALDIRYADHVQDARASMDAYIQHEEAWGTVLCRLREEQHYATL